MMFKFNKILQDTYKTFLERTVLSRWTILFIDIFIVSGAILLAYFLSLQVYKNIALVTPPVFLEVAIITVSITIFFFLVFRTYKGIIRYSSVNDFSRLITSLFIADVVVFFVFYQQIGLSGSVALTYTCILFMASLIGILGFRMFVVYTYQMMTKRYRTKPILSVFLWGVSQDNIVFAQSVNNGRSRYRVVGLIDIKPDKKIQRVTTLDILDYEDSKSLLCLERSGILFTNKNIIKDQRDIVEKFISRNIPIYFTQDIDIKNTQQLNEALNIIRSIEIEDLLGRPQIDISMQKIGEALRNKVVLVTGAAGSIGSEIVRQIAPFSPQMIICLDQAETPLNDLFLELTKKYPDLNFTTIIGDVKNQNKLQKVFDKYHPQIIYHAAAYKHVPMMETNPSEAIKTNVMGTKLLVDIAVENEVEMFVMVSTDKAVNPTNIMGASKRIAEIYVQSMAMNLKKIGGHTKFVTTRFGNVLGSNGSVIPLFRNQIEKGGPITVTHPDIIRYFMTIPEACRLVLEASVIGESGYIYIFDMGEPVKIFDLAIRMIKLAGLRPDVDIRIEFSGLRPGEKLFEELLADKETSEDTTHPKVMRSKVREYSFDDIEPQINYIISNALDEHAEEMVISMKKLVPEYISKNSVFEKLD